MNNNTIEGSFNNLINWIESEEYIGWDPYDILNSWVPFIGLANGGLL
jgi:hypothetical protein